jgi:hypothetical protein
MGTPLAGVGIIAFIAASIFAAVLFLTNGAYCYG